MDQEGRKEVVVASYRYLLFCLLGVDFEDYFPQTSMLYFSIIAGFEDQKNAMLSRLLLEY